MRTLIDRPVCDLARSAFACPLGGGKVLGMDDVKDTPLHVAKQYSNALVSNEGALKCLEAF